MSLLFAAALIASAATTVPNCSWDRPGVEPFMGNLVASVDRYDDIPADVRARLKQRMAARQYDELVTIKRDAIVGRERYEPQIRDMHFGNGRIWHNVTRSNWGADSQERGLVYCDSGQCLLVPTVCRNLSRITRLPTLVATPGPLPPGQGGGGGPGTFAGGAAPAGDGGATDGPRSRGLQVASGGAVGSSVGGSDATASGTAFADAVAGSAYPLVQGPVGTISFYPGGGAVIPTAAVPEPATALLWLLGMAGLAATARRRRSPPSY